MGMASPTLDALREVGGLDVLDILDIYGIYIYYIQETCLLSNEPIGWRTHKGGGRMVKIDIFVTNPIEKSRF